MLATILVIIAIVLALIEGFTTIRLRNAPFLPIAVVLIGVALLIGGIDLDVFSS
jgi:predicted RND superfamily exporter protein